MYIYKIYYAVVLKVDVKNKRFKRKRYCIIDDCWLNELYGQIHKHRDDQTGIKNFFTIMVGNLISETEHTMGTIREIDFECWATVGSDISDYRKQVLISRDVYLDKKQFDDLMESVVEAVMKDNCLWETNDTWKSDD